MPRLFMMMLMTFTLGLNLAAANPTEGEQATKAAEPATPATPAEPAMAEQPPTMTKAELDRAQFTLGINNREPIDNVDSVGNNVSMVYFFTDIREGQGQTISHEWLHNGEVMASVAFDVKGNRWRVWSSKDLVPEWTGAWSVRVVDAAGNVLADKSFEYTEAAMSTPAVEDAMSEAEMKPAEAKPEEMNPAAEKK